MGSGGYGDQKARQEDKAEHVKAAASGGVSRLGPSTSQDDVMKAEASMPGMHEVGIGPGGCVQPLGQLPNMGPVPAAPLPSVDYHTQTPPGAQEILSRPVVYAEVTGDRSVNYEFLNLTTQQSIEIVRYLLPVILNRFLAKNRDYGDGFLNLGPKAEFVRMANKFGKLKQALWDGQDLEFEQVDEIIDDLIGHLLLARLGLS